MPVAPPYMVLERGYVRVTGPGGTALTSALDKAEASPTSRFSLRTTALAFGTRRDPPLAPSPAVPRQRRAAARENRAGPQDDLFG